MTTNINKKRLVIRLALVALLVLLCFVLYYIGKEHEVLKTVVEKLNAIPTIPCTGCRYCVDDCPMQIHIPDIFRAVNHQKQFGSEGNVDRSGYESATREGGKASECLHCGSCEAH